MKWIILAGDSGKGWLFVAVMYFGCIKSRKVFG
jgi:hypothetical protein